MPFLILIWCFNRPISDDPTNSICIKIRVHVRACVPLVDIYNSFIWLVDQWWMNVSASPMKSKDAKTFNFHLLGQFLSSVTDKIWHLNLSIWDCYINTVRTKTMAVVYSFFLFYNKSRTNWYKIPPVQWFEWIMKTVPNA